MFMNKSKFKIVQYSTIIIIAIVISFFLLLSFGCSKALLADNVEEDTNEIAETRDPLKWPFASNSIWNTPIGDSAVYVRANLQPTMRLTVDEDIIVMTPEAPLMPIYKNFAGWNRNKDRCLKEGGLIYEVPFPDDFVYNSSVWDGLTPNAGLAVLMPDGRTIKQNQPFARCDSGSFGTSQYLFADEDIYGTGIYGAHGGSGLSAIGGALRYWELQPGSVIRHALKINLFGRESISKEMGGHRWPAKVADSGYNNANSGNYYGGSTPACRMGALLAIRPADLDSLSSLMQTEPGLILLKAFTDYGAYLVDNTAWDVWAIITSIEPEGRFTDEFKKTWGFDFVPKKGSAWDNDVETIYQNLYVIDNNGPNSIGGGGKPRQPMAPDFIKK